MKTKEKNRICFHCIHYTACQSWNIGSLVETDASNCVNFETYEMLKEYIEGDSQNESNS